MGLWLLGVGLLGLEGGLALPISLLLLLHEKLLLLVLYQLGILDVAKEMREALSGLLQFLGMQLESIVLELFVQAKISVHISDRPSPEPGGYCCCNHLVKRFTAKNFSCSHQIFESLEVIQILRDELQVLLQHIVPMFLQVITGKRERYWSARLGEPLIDTELIDDAKVSMLDASVHLQLAL